jgi:hypothetical protein
MSPMTPATLALGLSILLISTFCRIGFFQESRRWRRLYSPPCKCGHFLSLHGLASGGCMACSCAAYEASAPDGQVAA